MSEPNQASPMLAYHIALLDGRLVDAVNSPLNPRMWLYRGQIAGKAVFTHVETEEELP